MIYMVANGNAMENFRSISYTTKIYKAFGALDTMPLTNGKELIKD